MAIAYPKRRRASRPTSTCVRESKFVSEDDFWGALSRAEQAEADLSYLSACQSERARKLAGSYFTPADGACFFWDQFFSIAGISGPSDAIQWIRECRFIEPAAGAGALVFALLYKLQAIGVNRRDLEDIDLTVIDINPSALKFIELELCQRSGGCRRRFPNVTFRCEDFRDAKFYEDDKKLVVFGNPPFVRNASGVSTWKNLFADFLDRALDLCGSMGSVQFILPLSISFSRDYRGLRSRLLQDTRTVALSNFDNMPDTFFRSGKPKSTNTNKANSQRCTVLTVCPSTRMKVLSTALQTWRAREREKFFKRLPRFYEVTDLTNETTIPRPIDQALLDYLRFGSSWLNFRDMLDRRGRYPLYVAGVARNYIGVREGPGPGIHELRFGSKRAWRVALLLLTSDLFLAYWRSFGDGFHITKANIDEFPVERKLYGELVRQERVGERIWQSRAAYLKTKNNNGVEAKSYDMTSCALSLLPRIGAIDGVG